MVLSTVKDVYTYLAKGMIKLFKNVGMSDEDIKSCMKEAITNFKKLDLEDKQRVDDICSAVNEELKDTKKK